MSQLTVRPFGAARPHASAADTADLRGGWRPQVWLGAPARGGLALPSASPSMAWMYSPRAVFVDADHVVVADSGNHRVLIWHGVPTEDGQPADVVLGQPDGTSEGRAAGGRGPDNGMNLPTGVLIHDGRLIVADAWHHRVLVWDKVPQTSGTPPNAILGQFDAFAVEPNAGRSCSSSTLYWPFGIALIGSRFWVADTGNRRVLGWDGGVPEPGRPADIVLGQRDATLREENRGGAVSAASFRWPHGLAGREDLLLVADAGDHRILGWSPQPSTDRPADLVLGQPDFTTAQEWPYGSQRADRFRFPYAVALDDTGVEGERLVIADTANNRILMWSGVPTGGAAADVVLAQPTFGSNGENRWSAVEHDTLCWPFGISLRGDVLAVADSGNNRVMIWRRS